MTAPTGFVASPAGYSVPAPDVLRGHLVAGQQSFAAGLAASDPGTLVPTCPGWTLRELAWHLGTVHRWVVGAIREGRSLDLEETGPDDADALSAWYAEAAGDLVRVLDETGPVAEVWHFGPRPRTAAFWLRRQAHETAMHLADLRIATGAGPDVPTDLAVDGVDEVATVFFPRQVKLGRIPALERSLAVLPDEAGGLRWVLAGDGATPADDLGEADATLHGPASLLVGVLWGRAGTDAVGVRLEGDPAAAESVLGAGLTP